MTAVYLHIPFCKTHCPYCDFAVWLDHKGYYFDKYTEALCHEIACRADGSFVRTIYLGGGTPSILPLKNLKQIFAHLNKYFELFLNQAEITLELNPGTVDKAKLAEIKNLGINRLSIGVQTFEPTLLSKLARGHTVEQAFEVLQWAKEIGFNNISLDLIYGLPQQTIADWEETINITLDQPVQHISCYALTIEEGTPFKKIYNDSSHPLLPSEDRLVQMYETLQNKLGQAGFEQYEVSNFAKAGFESKHNLTYWHNKKFYGFGVSAHEFMNGQRKAHTKSLEEYLSNPTEQIILDCNLPLEELMLALRTKYGLNLQKYQKKYQKDIIKNNFDFLSQAAQKGFIEFDKKFLKITSKGFLLSNEIIAKLVFD